MALRSPGISFPLTGAAGTITASQPVLDLSQTWNAGGVTFTGLRFNATDTASASGSLLMDLQVAASSKFSVTKAGGLTTSGNITATGSTINAVNVNSGVGGAGTIGLGNRVFLIDDAANTLALRNGANAQTFNVYTTYTDASNYERVRLIAGGGSGNVLSSDAAGTGTARPLLFQQGGTNVFGVSTGSLTLAFWNVSAGNLLAGTDNTYDIGASGANRPRTVYVGTSVVAPAGGYVKTTATTVSGLPSASTAGAGARAFVTDATATTFLSTVAGGGSNKVPVVSDGTNWLIG